MVGVSLLKQHESDLASALLPDDPDPTIPLSDSTRFRTHAYLVLACAIIEEHIEDAFREYVDRSADRDDDAVSGCFLTLMAKFGEIVVGQRRGAMPAASDAVPALVGLYSSKVLTPNNGVKRRNIEALAKPLGLGARLEAECEELLDSLDVLGAKRGAIAHLGVIQEEIRPKEARGYVLAAIDKMDGLGNVLADEESSASGATSA